MSKHGHAGMDGAGALDEGEVSRIVQGENRDKIVQG